MIPKESKPPYLINVIAFIRLWRKPRSSGVKQSHLGLLRHYVPRNDQSYFFRGRFLPSPSELFCLSIKNPTNLITESEIKAT